MSTNRINATERVFQKPVSQVPLHKPEAPCHSHALVNLFLFICPSKNLKQQCDC